MSRKYPNIYWWNKSYQYPNVQIKLCFLKQKCQDKTFKYEIVYSKSLWYKIKSTTQIFASHGYSKIKKDSLENQIRFLKNMCVKLGTYWVNPYLFKIFKILRNHSNIDFFLCSPWIYFPKLLPSETIYELIFSWSVCWAYSTAHSTQCY